MKITNKEEFNKAFHKKRLAGFWKHKWIPGRTIENWIFHISNNRRSVGIINDAIVKLYLQNKISSKESAELQKMIKAIDKESIYLAISIIYSLKPRMFERKKAS